MRAAPCAAAAPSLGTATTTLSSVASATGARPALGSGTPEKDNLPIPGLIRRGGQVALRMLADMQQATTKLTIEAVAAKGIRVHTDEDGIHARLLTRGCRHKTACHARGEYARDDDGDGFCEEHVNTPEGFWPLLRPHPGILQDKLPPCRGVFQLAHNTRRCGNPCLAPLSPAWLRGKFITTPEPNKSL